MEAELVASAEDGQDNEMDASSLPSEVTNCGERRESRGQTQDQYPVGTGVAQCVASRARRGTEGTHVDRNTLTTESTASSNTVDVVLSVGGQVVAVKSVAKRDKTSGLVFAAKGVPILHAKQRGRT